MRRRDAAAQGRRVPRVLGRRRIRFLRRPGAPQPAGMVRAAPGGLRDRGARPAAGAGGGDGRTAGPDRARAHGRSRGARSSGSTATSGSPRDKSPYKTNAACQFYHQDAGRGAGQDADGAAAGLYFQLADGECFVAGGIWMPARPALEKIREAIAADPEALDRLVRAPAFRRRFKALDPEAVLTRMPRGYAEAHAAARLAAVQVVHRHPDADGAGGAEPAAPATSLARDFAALVPLVRWLNEAIGYPSRDRRF